jgi:hypothetical protein
MFFGPIYRLLLLVKDLSVLLFNFSATSSPSFSSNHILFSSSPFLNFPSLPPFQLPPPPQCPSPFVLGYLENSVFMMSANLARLMVVIFSLKTGKGVTILYRMVLASVIKQN